MNLIRSIGIKKVTALFILYLLANITYLLNFNGVYWDDWVIYNQEIPTLLIFFDEIKNTIQGQFFFALSEIGNGIYIFRLTLFAMYFFSGLMIIHILRSMKLFDDHAAYFIGLFYLILPIFHTKAALCIIPFYFSVFLFFAAWFWLSRGIGSLYWGSRVGILALFFASFTTNSLLVVYGLVILYILYKQVFEKEVGGMIFRRVVSFLRYNIDFILLPILFFTFKLIYLKPYGLYENYNQLEVEALKQAFFKLPNAFDSVLLQHMERSISLAWEFGLLAVFCICGFLLISKKRSFHNIKFSSITSLLIIGVIGTIGLILAVFPYLAVNKIPVPLGWNSRFQILAILPASLIFYSVTALGLSFLTKLSRGFMKERYRFIFSVGVVTFFIATFIARGFYDQHRLNMDWFYQAGIQQSFLESSIISKNKTFVVDNKIRASLAYSRYLSYYEWNGLLKQGFGGDDSRLMVPPFSFSRISKISSATQGYKQYNFSTWKMTQPILVTIDYNKKLSRELIIQLYWYRLFDHERFVALAKDLVLLSYKEYALNKGRGFR